jgi:transcription elongation factor GreB
VELYRHDGATVKYRLVGPDELNPVKNYISIDSVLGKALLGKRLDDEVRVETPSGLHQYEIVAVNYDPTESD